MARELGPRPAEPDTMVERNVDCYQCHENYDTTVREHIEGDTVTWTWTCPVVGCGYDNEERVPVDVLQWEGGE